MSNEFYRHEINEDTWNPEFAAKKVEQILGLERGQHTYGPLSPTGQAYIVFANGCIKDEGEEVKNSNSNVYQLWKCFVNGIEEYYFNLPNNAKIYWRKMPQLEYVEEKNQYDIVARLCVG